MGIKQITKILLSSLLLVLLMPIIVSGEEASAASLHKERHTAIEQIDTEQPISRFTFDSGFTFEYPDAVRGIYVTGNSAGGSRFEDLLDLIDYSDLNSMVIDIKEDHGNLTFIPEEGSPYEDIAMNYISDPEEMMRVLEEEGIYPRA